MRLIFILNILILFNNKFANSQNIISIGFGTNYNSSNINFHNNFFPQNIKSNSISNIDFTFISEIKNNKRTGIRIEFSKKYKGWSQNYLNNNVISKFQFYNIPIMMTTYFGNKKTKINFSIGPFAEFQIKNNSKHLIDNFPDMDFYFDELRDNNFGYGLVAKSGFSLDLNKSSFQISIAYQHNFDNLIDMDIKSSSIPDISSFNTLSISFVYLYNFLNKNEL